ncbi:hypothetical protein [Gordonia shandongensis]|uniref:hypothetical protein n=1 Tax=Gordonia shandongensis TaxID=376351 RepID=UPI000425F57E|nr:hypothetical protein [Gordonia shandongensis]
MQTRVLPFAVIISAATAIAVTALPWISLRTLGFDVSWNGLGMSQGAGGAVDAAPAGRGWLIVAVAAVAILGALAALAPSPAVRPFAGALVGTGAAASIAAVAVPLAIWIHPSWYLGDFVTAYQLPDDVAVSKPILGGLIVILLLLGALCVGLYRELSGPGSS